MKQIRDCQLIHNRRLSRSDIGAGENNSTASSTAAVNDFQSTLVVFCLGCAMGRRGRRYFASDGGRDGEMVGAEIFAYRPLGPGWPGIADSCQMRRADRLTWMAGYDSNGPCRSCDVVVVQHLQIQLFLARAATAASSVRPEQERRNGV